MVMKNPPYPGAVNRERLFIETVETVKSRNAAFDQQDILEAVDRAVEAARAKVRDSLIKR